LVVHQNPFQAYLGKIKKFVDGVKFTIDVVVLLACPTILTDVDSSLVVQKY
jgi:hypothetical protein